MNARIRTYYGATDAPAFLLEERELVLTGTTLGDVNETLYHQWQKAQPVKADVLFQNGEREFFCLFSPEQGFYLPGSEDLPAFGHWHLLDGATEDKEIRALLATF